MTDAWSEIVILSLAVSALSLTLTKAQVSAGLRQMVQSRSAWLGELLSCPYCTSHWLALGAVLIFRPVVTNAWLPIDLAVTMFAIVALAALASGLIFTSISKIAH